jgi:hypothetical protein
MPSWARQVSWPSDLSSSFKVVAASTLSSTTRTLARRRAALEEHIEDALNHVRLDPGSDIPDCQRYAAGLDGRRRVNLPPSGV